MLTTFNPSPQVYFKGTSANLKKKQTKKNGKKKNQNNGTSTRPVLNLKLRLFMLLRMRL